MHGCNLPGFLPLVPVPWKGVPWKNPVRHGKNFSEHKFSSRITICWFVLLQLWLQCGIQLFLYFFFYLVSSRFFHSFFFSVSVIINIIFSRAHWPSLMSIFFLFSFFPFSNDPHINFSHTYNPGENVWDTPCFRWRNIIQVHPPPPWTVLGVTSQTPFTYLVHFRDLNVF